MAQIDASIPLGVRPAQIENPMNALARVMQIKNMQQDGELGQMKMDEYRRGVQETAALNRLYSAAMKPDGSFDRAALFSGAAREGLGSKIPAWRKAFAEEDDATTKAAQAKFKLATERHDYFKKTLGVLSQEPNLTKEMVVQAGQSLVQQGILPQEMFQQSMANMPDDPAQLRARLVQGVKAQMSPEQIFTVFAPKPEKQDNGQTISYVDNNPNSPTYGQATGAAPVQKVATPDSVLSAQTSEANNRRSVGAQYDLARATREAAATNKQAQIEAARIQTGFQNEQGLRKEFEALPEVKKYKQALPSYKGIEDAVKRNTTQSDINIVYGIAKLYDPDSVVREGEYATVANSPNIPERIKGYAQYLAGGGRLTPAVKAQILDEARSRMKSYEEQFTAARNDFDSIAKRSNVDPTRVFPSPVAPAVAPQPVDLGALPAGQAGTKPKIVDFGGLK
jgi:hypothetical protein